MPKISDELIDLIRSAGAKHAPRDSILAHITAQQAELLRARGGSGEVDPVTGLTHYDDDGGSGAGDNTSSGDNNSTDSGTDGGASQSDAGGGATSENTSSVGDSGSGWGWSYSPATTENSATYAYTDQSPANGQGTDSGMDQSVTSTDPLAIAENYDVNTPDEVNFSEGSMENQGGGLAGSLGTQAQDAISGYDFSQDTGLSDARSNEYGIQYGLGPLGYMQNQISQHPTITSILNALVSVANPVAGLVTSGLTNAAKGTPWDALGSLAGYFGGSLGRGVGSLAGDVLGGKTEQQTIADALNSAIGYGLNSSGLSLGQSGYNAGGLLGGVAGSMAQGYGTNALTSGLSSSLASADQSDFSSSPSDSGYSGDFSGVDMGGSGDTTGSTSTTIASTDSSTPTSTTTTQSPTASLDSVLQTGKDGQPEDVWNQSSLRLMNAFNV